MATKDHSGRSGGANPLGTLIALGSIGLVVPIGLAIMYWTVVVPVLAAALLAVGVIRFAIWYPIGAPGAEQIPSASKPNSRPVPTEAPALGQDAPAAKVRPDKRARRQQEIDPWEQFRADKRRRFSSAMEDWDREWDLLLGSTAHRTPTGGACAIPPHPRPVDTQAADGPPHRGRWMAGAT